MPDLMALGDADVLLLDFEPERAPNTMYVTLHHKLINARGKQVARRKIGNNTYAERCVNEFGKPAIAVRLHHTRVVIHTAYTMQFDTGGWLTVTTKDRMNAWSRGVSIYSERGTWMVRIIDGNECIPYTNNMVMHWTPNGWATNAPDSLRADTSAHNTAVRAMVKRWLDAMPDTLMGTYGSGGSKKFNVECVSCVNADRFGTRNVGDEFDYQGHLYEHMINQEYPLNLVVTGCYMLSTQIPNMFHSEVDSQSRQAHAIVRKALRYAVLTRLLTGVVAVSKR